MPTGGKADSQGDHVMVGGGRLSTSFRGRDVDGRDKPGHDIQVRLAPGCVLLFAGWHNVMAGPALCKLQLGNCRLVQRDQQLWPIILG
jgi:hypothetical protein